PARLSLSLSVFWVPGASVKRVLAMVIGFGFAARGREPSLFATSARVPVQVLPAQLSGTLSVVPSNFAAPSVALAGGVEPTDGALVVPDGVVVVPEGVVVVPDGVVVVPGESGTVSSVAVPERAWSIVTLQVSSVPLQAPLQPVKTPWVPAGPGP